MKILKTKQIVACENSRDQSLLFVTREGESGHEVRLLASVEKHFEPRVTGVGGEDVGDYYVVVEKGELDCIEHIQVRLCIPLFHIYIYLTQ
jgi:hypothetical protein